MYRKGHMVINTINEMIAVGKRTVTTKTIRIFNNIASSDRSSVNLISRNLDYLANRGFITLIKDIPLKMYNLPKEPIKLEAYQNG